MVRNGGRHVIIRPGLNGRQVPVVFQMAFRGKEPIVIFHAVGAIEAAPEPGAVDMPLAGVIRAVAKRAQSLRQQGRPGGSGAATAASDVRDGVATDLLRIVSGQDGAARWPAACRVVKLCESEPVGGQPIQGGRGNFSAITTQIGEAHVISQDEQNIGLGRSRLAFAGGGIRPWSQSKDDH